MGHRSRGSWVTWVVGQLMGHTGRGSQNVTHCQLCTVSQPGTTVRLPIARCVRYVRAYIKCAYQTYVPRTFQEYRSLTTRVRFSHQPVCVFARLSLKPHSIYCEHVAKVIWQKAASPQHGIPYTLQLAARILNIAPFPRGIWTPSNTWFLGPTPVHNPKGILISSAIFAGITIVTDRQTNIQTTLLCL